MNRKQFLKNLGLLFGAAIVAPEVLAETKNKPGIIEIDKIKFKKFADDYAKRASEQLYLREPKLMVFYGTKGVGKNYGPHDFNKFTNI